MKWNIINNKGTIIVCYINSHSKTESFLIHVFDDVNDIKYLQVRYRSKMIKIGYFLIGDSRVNNNYNNTEFWINP